MAQVHNPTLTTELLPLCYQGFKSSLRRMVPEFTGSHKKRLECRALRVRAEFTAISIYSIDSTSANFRLCYIQGTSQIKWITAPVVLCTSDVAPTSWLSKILHTIVPTKHQMNLRSAVSKFCTMQMETIQTSCCLSFFAAGMRTHCTCTLCEEHELEA
eukprot:1307078-Amphidinium_carterae.1